MGKHFTLDDADRAIIDLLTADGRMSNRDISNHVGLTEVTVASRLRRLQEHGVFRVNAIVDWTAAGYAFGLVFWISVEGAGSVSAAHEISSDHAVHVVGLTLGSVDIIAFAFASEVSEIDRLTRKFTSVEGVARVVVQGQYETCKYSHRYALLSQRQEELHLPNPAIALDDLDRQILRLLVGDGHLSNRRVARLGDASEGTIRSRLRRLEDADLLRIRGQVDPVLADELSIIGLVAVTLDGRHDDEVVARLIDNPQVLSVGRMTGASQLILSVGGATRADLVNYLLNDLRGIEGVKATETWEVIRYVKMISHFGRFI